jgi:EAL domain-containing protein (putative c-di-GMP-specific phosphodiesterase class I)
MQPDVWSPLQLVDATFVDVVLEALARGLPPQSLILEFTEHAAVTSTSAVNEVLEALRTHGVCTALDHFGVGFSSLRHLRELSVDLIKIDRSFVVDDGEKGDSMLGAIVSLASQMGLTVIAEGIEEKGQLERLQRLGPLAGQGYLFARPMPIARAALVLQEAACPWIGTTQQPASTAPRLPRQRVDDVPSRPALPFAER